MIKIKDGKYLSLILFTLFLILSDINVFAFNTITPNSSGVNFQANVHGDPVDTNGNYYHYRTHTGATGRGDFGSVVSGKFNGFIGYVSNVPIIGGNHYRITFNTSTRDLRPAWSSSDIKVCFNFVNLVDCATVNNIKLIGPNSAGTYFNSASFDFYFSQLNYGTVVNNDWFILINGSLVTNNGNTYPQLGLNNLDLSGDNNWKFDSVNIKITATDDPPPPVDPDDPDDPLDNSGSVTELLQENNNWLKKIHDKLDKFFDTSIDTSSFESFFNTLSQKIPGNQVVTGLITLPNLILNGLNDHLSDTCDSVIFGMLYGSILKLECFNPRDYMGFTTWGLIDVIFSAMLVYGWSRQIIKIYDKLTTLSKEGDIID